MTDPASTEPQPGAAPIRRHLARLYAEAHRTGTEAQDAAVRYVACEPSYRAAEAAAVETSDWKAATSAHTRRAHVVEEATNAILAAAVARHHFEAALAGAVRVDAEVAYLAAEQAAAEAGDYAAAAGYAAARSYAAGAAGAGGRAAHAAGREAPA